MNARRILFLLALVGYTQTGFSQTPPSQPANVTAGTITETTIAISWTESTSDNDVTEYRILVDGSEHGTSATPGYLIDNLLPATTYSITVIAVDDALNESEPSEILEKTTLADTDPPTIPAGLAAGEITSNSIAVSWDASTDNVGVVDYRIYLNGIVHGTSEVNNYTIDGLTPETLYAITVTARDAVPNESAQSEPFNVSTIAAPDEEAPTVPGGITVGEITSTSIAVSWEASTDNVAVVDYRIYLDGDVHDSSVVTNYTIEGLLPEAPHTITVTARDAVPNESAQSAPLEATTLAAPDEEVPTVPTGLTADAVTATSILVSWTASTDNVGVTEYVIFEGVNEVGTTPSTNFEITGLSQGILYSITIRARDAALNESASSEPLVQRTLDTETPTIPAGVTAGIITGNSIAISWTASTDNVGVVRYAIFLDDTEFDTTSFTNYTITGLEQATEYKIKIRARDAASNESEDSETLTLSTLDTEAPTAPTGLTAGTITATSIVISWTASTDNVGVAGYAVFVGGSEVGNTTSTIFMIPDLEQGIQYTITVRARDAALNESESSEPILLSTLDTEAPTTPTAVIAGNVTGTSIAISWTASTDNIEVIEYGIFVGGAEVGTTSNTNFTITGLEQGTSYTITVRARDAALNESPHSAELSQATLDTQAPTTPASLQSGTITVTSIAMSWTASTDNVGVTSYTIYRDNAELFSTSGTTYTATGLDPGTSYEFYVVARDAAGNESLPSNLLIASTQADTEAPTEPFNLTASGLSEFSIRLNWTAATDNIGVTGYFIYQDGAQIGSTTGGLTYTASGLLPESEHTYSVSAVDEAGNESEQSNPATASTFSEPDTESPSVPASLNANAITYNSLHLQWSASTDNVGVEYYAIFRNGVEIDTSATTEYDVTALEPLTSYDFFVVAYDAAANPSINSDTLTLTTKKLPDIIAPSIPQNLTISDTLDTGMRFSWTPSTDNDGVADYLIYMNNKLIAISDTSAYLIENLKPLVEYNFFVAARDSSGNISEASSQLQFAITDPGPDLIAPTTPVNLTATDSTETSITLMWNSAYDWFGVTDYWLYVNDILSLITSDTTATVNGLTHDNEYRFSLSASDAAGNFSGRSDTLVAHTLGLTTGIEEYSFNNLFHIRSLESGIAIHISPTPEIRDLIVRIVNLQGVVVSMDHINSVNTEMSIETVLKPGVYVLQCLDGHHTYSQSFLVL